MKKFPAYIIASLLLLVFTGHQVRAGKIDSGLQEILHGRGAEEEVSVIITLADQVPTKNFKDKDKKQRRSRMIRALQDKADKTQKDIRNFLQQKKAKKIKSFWIFNGLAATARKDVIQALAGRPGISSISIDATLSAPEPQVAASPGLPEWNINMIRAPELWDRGYDGSGMVLASMDTGVDYSHPDLTARWRGGDNSWHDVHGVYDLPYDHSGHGTQVMGIMVGGDALGSAIGVAPGAQWIAVKIFNDAGAAQASDMLAGFQWLLDPDKNPDTDDAPDVINNSWGYPYELGCYLLDYLGPAIRNLKTAGIGVVFSAGNSGRDGVSTGESPATYPDSFAVGAIDENQTIAYFSSRGPSSCDQTVFPEAVAPGVNIRTADLGGSYAYVQGTSIAAPHVSGAMALLMSAYSSLSISEIETAITEAALELGPTGPDDSYGYGMLDVMGAYDLLNLNQLPIAGNDMYTIPRNISALLHILANDIDPDGFIDAASVVFKSGTAQDTTARGGSVTANVDGTVTYLPEGSGGPDYFWYRVKDNDGLTSNEAAVRINRVGSSAETTTVVPNSAIDGDRRVR